jgi:hypothetical protein
MSTRVITTATKAAAIASETCPVLLCELEFPTAPVRVWSGYGTLTWSGRNFAGVATLGKVSDIEESSDVSAKGLTLSLVGIPSEILALALSENYQQRPGRLWIGFMNASAQLIADPIQIFAGRMDVMSTDDGGSTGTLKLTLENNLIDFARPRERRYTDIDQQMDYPGDLGLEYVAGLQDKAIYWGRPLPK